jgi:hypothetical protein
MMLGGPRFNPLAILSMAFGILSIPGCCCVFFGSPMAVAGLVLGLVSMQKIRASPQMYKGLSFATVGIVCSSLGLMLDLLAMFSRIDDNLKHQYGGF